MYIAQLRTWRTILFILILSVCTIPGCQMLSKKGIKNIKTGETNRMYQFFRSSDEVPLSVEQLAQKLEIYDVVFFGEIHDDPLIHTLQLELFRKLLEGKKNVVLSMEMFERDSQKVLDSFLSDETDEETFLKQSNPWPDYTTFYKPLVDEAKKNTLPVIAANVPRHLAFKYAQGGLEALHTLDGPEKSYVARSITIDEGPYMTEFYASMAENMGEAANYQFPPNLENTIHLFYGAQVVKDETMAESILHAFEPGSMIFHVNGDFHSRQHLGTAAKVASRQPDLKIAVIAPAYISHEEVFSFPVEERKAADFLLVLHEKADKEEEHSMGSHFNPNYVTKHTISVTIEPDTSQLRGHDVLTMRNPIVKSAVFHLLGSLTISRIHSEEKPVRFETVTLDELYQEIRVFADSRDLKTLEIGFEGPVSFYPEERKINQKHASSPGLISAKEGEGIYLPPGSFYPYTEHDLASFELTVTAPEEFVFISSGEMDRMESKMMAETRFTSGLPVDGLTLVGGRYHLLEMMTDKTIFRCYSFNRKETFSPFLEAAQKYHDLYSSLLGPYPYSSFSIVENFFPTGYALPGFTLLSGRLMQMPWIVLSPGALAHEFVHNWWGNGVLMKTDSGNWCEGLTSFCTNYYYNIATDQPEKAREWRQKALTDYALLPDNRRYPLKNFMEQKIDEDAVIGYQKSAFVFYELFKVMGRDHFFGALRTFRDDYLGKRARWQSISFSFQKYARKHELELPLDRIFEQWLSSEKLPKLELSALKKRKGVISFKVMQDMDLYMLVPLQIVTDSGRKRIEILLIDNDNSYEIPVQDEVKHIHLDPDYEALRYLYPWERPLTLKETINSNPILVVSGKDSKNYEIAEEFSTMLTESGYHHNEVSASGYDLIKLKEKNALIIGTPDSNPLISELLASENMTFDLQARTLSIDGIQYSMKGFMLLHTMTHPQNNAAKLSIITYDSITSSRQFKRLFHYLNESTLLLDQSTMGKPLLKKQQYPKIPEKNPMKIVLK